MTNLEQAFEALGEPAKAEKCPGIEGIKKEHDDFVANKSRRLRRCSMPSSPGAGRDKHYEIAAYEGLVTMATAMGEDDVASLLNENLSEKAALAKLQTIGERLAQRTESVSGVTHRCWRVEDILGSPKDQRQHCSGSEI